MCSSLFSLSTTWLRRPPVELFEISDSAESGQVRRVGSPKREKLVCELCRDYVIPIRGLETMSMAKRTNSIILACLTVVMMSGCGPTKSGIQARVDARKRMDLVNAKITFEQASQAFESGDFDRAMQEVDAAINRYEVEPSYHLLRGRIFLETQRLEQAVKSFEVVRDMDVNNAKAWYYSGIVFQRWSDDRQAFGCYKQAFEIDSHNIHYLLAAAESLIALGEYEAANELILPKLVYFEYNASLKQQTRSARPPPT